ncbi:hypothetical protein QP185_22330 [Sphingomonas aerolata]|uniref:hypothetical protein n=1 Tax=Sphingomonas aerolata TaxID=185951 RepID=UPI002FE25929
MITLSLFMGVLMLDLSSLGVPIAELVIEFVAVVAISAVAHPDFIGRLIRTGRPVV